MKTGELLEELGFFYTMWAWCVDTISDTRYNVNLGSNKKCYYEVCSQRARAALTMNYQFRRLIVRTIFMNNKTIEMLREGTLDPAGLSPSLGNQTKNLCLSKP